MTRHQIKLYFVKKSPPWLYLSIKLLFTKKNLYKPSTLIAVGGLAVGVGTLMVSMAVISGYAQTLKRAVSDSTGHVQILRTSAFSEDWLTLVKKIREIEPSLQSATRFAYAEGVVAQKGKVFGVVLQGLDPETYANVLNLKNRLISGDVNFVSKKASHEAPEILSKAIIGKGIAQKLNLKVGERLNVIIPLMQSLNGLDQNQFRRKLIQLEVVGVIDLGKFDWNEKFIVSDLLSIQQAAELNQSYTGLFLKFEDINYARPAGLNISEKLGRGYWVKDWRDLNENLFDAVDFEKIIIFFVVFIIVIIAAFNLTSTIFINVLQSYSTLAVLKSLGLSQRDVLKMFSAQGIILGGLSLFFGFIFGVIFCFGFLILQSQLDVISGSVYKIDHIDLSVEWIDILMLTVATLLVCFFASLAPARRGSRLTISEGLKYG